MSSIAAAAAAVVATSASASSSLSVIATRALSASSYRVRVMFIRHGESEMNPKMHLIGGQHNHVPLTALGVSQATFLGTRLKFDRVTFDHVYSSTAVRALCTAQISIATAGSGVVAAGAGEIQQEPALLEQDQGDWEGKMRKDIYTKEMHVEMKRLNLDFHAPGGESLRMVQTRAVAFLSAEIDKWKIVSKNENRDIVIGVYSHGGCIRTLLHHYCGIHSEHAWLVAQDNTAISEILFDQKGMATIRINDSAHLKYTMTAPIAAQL